MERKFNWHIWIGFLLCVVGFLSYFFFFVRYPVTRDVPWANFLILGAGFVFLGSGLWRAFGRSQEYKGKILGPILGFLGFSVAAFFCFAIFFATKQLPKSTGAPKVGQKAPEFNLVDTDRKQVSLASLLATPLPNSATPPKGVFLIFYRGYW
jgi:Na+/proline symporter